MSTNVYMCIYINTYTHTTPVRKEQHPSALRRGQQRAGLGNNVDIRYNKVSQFHAIIKNLFRANDDFWRLLRGPGLTTLGGLCLARPPRCGFLQQDNNKDEKAKAAKSGSFSGLTRRSREAMISGNDGYDEPITGRRHDCHKRTVMANVTRHAAVLPLAPRAPRRPFG